MKRSAFLALVAFAVLTCANVASAQLAGHWTFDNATTTATLLADTSIAGANNSGTFTAGTSPAGAAGVIGGSLELFGNQNINVGSSNDFETTTWTASMWANTDTLSGWRTAFGSWSAGPPNTVHFGLNIDGRWGDHGGGATGSDALAVADQWYHLVSRRNSGGESSLWVNGVKQATTVTGTFATPDTANVFIGTKNGSDNPFDGKIDDLGYFTELLSDGKIRSIYTLGLPTSMGSAFGFNYNLAQDELLFDAFDSQGTAIVGQDVWSFVSGLNALAGSAAPGDLFTNGGRTFLLLDSTGSGSGLQFAELPEPSTLTIWALMGALGVVVYIRRQKR